MSPEKQRIAIAKLCGIEAGVFAPGSFNSDPDDIGPTFGSSVLGYWCGGKLVPIPDYLNDLNAIHNAERRLLGEYIFELYTDLLSVMCGSYHNAVRATAAQRAEAILRVMKLWEE